MNQISKDSSDRHHEAFFLSSLIPCRHPYTQHNIGSRRTKIKQRAKHGTVYLLVHIFTIGITLEMAFGLHGSGLCFCIFHVESLEHVMNIFGLRDKSSLPQLLDLKAKKEPQLSHHR